MRYVAPTSSVKSSAVWLASLTGLPVGMDGGYETTMNTMMILNILKTIKLFNEHSTKNVKNQIWHRN